MIHSISKLAASPSLESLKPPAPAGKPGEFQGILEGALHQIQSTDQEAARATERFLSGETEELHNVALAAQRAEMTFELGLQVRNKVLQAYQEIMRMQM
jgi:flagellar hook-basal body complex protein FliE